MQTTKNWVKGLQEKRLEDHCAQIGARYELYEEKQGKHTFVRLLVVIENHELLLTQAISRKQLARAGYPLLSLTVEGMCSTMLETITERRRFNK